MRHPRVKPRNTDTFMHVYNRTVGSAGEFPFQDADKEYFIRRLKKLSEFYIIEPIAYQLMGNHFHILLHIPAEPPSAEEAAARYKHYYNGKRTIDPQSEACKDLADKLRDVSLFMKDLQQPFSRWFNRTRPVRRRGHLWAERFKNTVLEQGFSVWCCWKYIEMNPVRANMVEDPSDYRFCSFGKWTATGKHPYAEGVEKRLMPIFKGLLHTQSQKELHKAFRKEFARINAVERKESPDQVDTAIAVAAEEASFSTCMDRRVRYWVDGLVIGSDIFVRETVTRARVYYKVKKRRLAKAMDPDPDRPKQDLFCFKRLRTLIE